MKNELIKRFGEHRVHDLKVSEGEMPLLLLDLEIDSRVTIVMTNGLSNYKMPVPEKLAGREFNELYFCLPSYWEWDAYDNPQMNWVYKWIQRLAKYVVENKTWFGNGHTMPCGKDMEELSSTMKQNHFFLLDPILLEEALRPVTLQEKEINFLAIIPIFADEMDYKQGKGTFKLAQKLRSAGVTEKLDDFRATSLRSKWRLRR